MENLAAANPTACRFGVLGVLAWQQRADSLAGGRSGPGWLQTDCAGEVNVRVAACTWDGALYLWQTSPPYRVWVLLCSTKIKENFSAESRGAGHLLAPLICFTVAQMWGLPSYTCCVQPTRSAPNPCAEDLWACLQSCTSQTHHICCMYADGLQRMYAVGLVCTVDVSALLGH